MQIILVKPNFTVYLGAKLMKWEWLWTLDTLDIISAPKSVLERHKRVSILQTKGYCIEELWHFLGFHRYFP